MTEYIFDWKSNCENILKTGEYTTRNHQYTEQVVLFRYLIDRGLAQDEIYEKWSNTNSILYNKIKDDSVEINFHFWRIYRMAQKWEIKTYNKIIIYKSELDFINSMNVVRWIKEYVLTMLCIYKYYGLSWCKYDKDIKRFCYSVTYQKRERVKTIEKLSEAFNKYNICTFTVASSVPHYKINFISNVKDDVIVGQIDNPRQAPDLMGLIKCERVCPVCGKTYEYTSKNYHIDMCPECVKHERYKRNYQKRHEKT